MSGLRQSFVKKAIEDAKKRIGDGFYIPSIEKKIWEDPHAGLSDDAAIELPIEVYEVVFKKGDTELTYIISSRGEVKYIS